MRQVNSEDELFHQPDDVYFPFETKITNLFPKRTIMKFPKSYAMSDIKILKGNIKSIRFEINGIEVDVIKENGKLNLCDWFTLEKPFLLSEVAYSEAFLIFESEDDSDIVISYNKIRFGFESDTLSEFKRKFIPSGIYQNFTDAFEFDHNNFKILYKDGFAMLYVPNLPF
jgi:hypothetical protein